MASSAPWYLERHLQSLSPDAPFISSWLQQRALKKTFPPAIFQWEAVDSNLELSMDLPFKISHNSLDPPHTAFPCCLLSFLCHVCGFTVSPLLSSPLERSPNLPPAVCFAG